MQVGFIHCLLSAPVIALLPVNSALGYTLQSTHLIEMSNKCRGVTGKTDAALRWRVACCCSKWLGKRMAFWFVKQLINEALLIWRGFEFQREGKIWEWSRSRRGDVDTGCRDAQSISHLAGYIPLSLVQANYIDPQRWYHTKSTLLAKLNWTVSLLKGWTEDRRSHILYFIWI